MKYCSAKCVKLAFALAKCLASTGCECVGSVVLSHFTIVLLFINEMRAELHCPVTEFLYLILKGI